jgi:hypothetical protein
VLKPPVTNFLLLLLLTALTLAAVFGEAFLLGPHEHDGPGDSCSICQLIQAAKNLIKAFAAASSLLFASAITARFFLQHRDLFPHPLPTPVSLKVRFNS